MLILMIMVQSQARTVFMFPQQLSILHPVITPPTTSQPIRNSMLELALATKSQLTPTITRTIQDTSQ